jgi:hypothetical protein
MMPMARSTRRGNAVRTVVPAGRAWRPPIVGVALLFLATFAFAPVAVAGTSPQGGSETFDVYRPGVYSEQATWTWCTAASVQIMRNILLAGADHSSAHQQQFFDYMRAGNRYQLADHRGVDPQGFLAGLRHFVSPGYALVASPTFDAAVRSAVTQLRLTGKPVALIVAAGRHAWVLTGFTATADPARTTDFQVVSVRVVGPLYGRQSINGYDSPPDTSISYAALRRFLLPYRFPFAVTPWTGRYLTFQAIPATAAAGVMPLAL